MRSPHRSRPRSRSLARLGPRDRVRCADPTRARSRVAPTTSSTSRRPTSSVSRSATAGSTRTRAGSSRCTRPRPARASTSRSRTGRTGTGSIRSPRAPPRQISTGGNWQTANGIVKKYGLVAERSFVVADTRDGDVGAPGLGARGRQRVARERCAQAPRPRGATRRSSARSSIVRGRSPPTSPRRSTASSAPTCRARSASSTLAGGRRGHRRPARRRTSSSRTRARPAAVARATPSSTQAMSEWRQVYYPAGIERRVFQHPRPARAARRAACRHHVVRRLQCAREPRERASAASFNLVTLERARPRASGRSHDRARGLPGEARRRTRARGRHDARPSEARGQDSSSTPRSCRAPRSQFFRVKNSWGAARPDRAFSPGMPGYHDLCFDYLDGPVKKCVERDGNTDTTSCPSRRRCRSRTWSFRPATDEPSFTSRAIRGRLRSCRLRLARRSRLASLCLCARLPPAPAATTTPSFTPVAPAAAGAGACHRRARRRDDRARRLRSAIRRSRRRSRWSRSARPAASTCSSRRASCASSTPGTVHPMTTALDISSRITSGGEAGLLGIAFDPRFAENGFVYLHFTATLAVSVPGVVFQSVIARYHSNDGGATFDPASEKRLLVVDQPYSNHNGGNIAVRPRRLALHRARRRRLGRRSARATARTRTSCSARSCASIRRRRPVRDSAHESVRRRAADAPEIFAYGLRNTWKFSFDTA